MTPNTITLRRGTVACLMAVLAGASLAAPAGGSSALSDATSRYRQERAACLNGQTSQDRATCLREAGAALQEARRGSVESNPSYAANALRRCDKLPEPDRADCVARMQGRGSVSGSVEGGGLYRELVTRETLPPASPAPRTP